MKILRILSVFLMASFFFGCEYSAKKSEVEFNFSASADGQFTSPLHIEGKAPGNWFSEGVAVLEITDNAGSVLGSGNVEAQGEWMTTEKVDFSGDIPFQIQDPQTGNLNLTLRKSNPSGLPENEGSATLRIP